MNYASGVLARADDLRSGRTPFVLATVVRAMRPTSAKAGDRALILADGTIEGFVGGECAESSVRRYGLQVLGSGEALMLRILPDAPAGHTAEDPGLVTVANPCASGGMLEIFLEGVFPPPLVQVHGGGPIARALHQVGTALGYDLKQLADAGPAEPLTPEPDADAVIVASHGRDEVLALNAALVAGVPYVGLVASRKRGAQVLATLDVPAEAVSRVHTPAGLDIGARTAAEVALSIFAEIVAERPRQPAPAVAPGAAVSSPATAATAAAGYPAAQPETAGPALATDPVCRMQVAVADASIKLPHDGKMWYFCGTGCRDAFADDPDRFIPASGIR